MSIVVLVYPNWVWCKFCLFSKDNCIVIKVDVTETPLVKKFMDKVWLTPNPDSGGKTVTVKSDEMNCHFTDTL